MKVIRNTTNFQLDKIAKTFLVCLGLFTGSLPIMANSLVFAPNGGVDSTGDFLHGVGQDVINDYNDLDRGNNDIDNYSEVNITNATDSLVIVSQVKAGLGRGNKSSVNQVGVSNTAIVGQIGSGNIAYINQEGDGNAAAIGQLGTRSEALINQDGNNNLAVIGQANMLYPSSKLSVNQENDNNIAFVAGSGGADLGISQDGGDAAIVNASGAMRIYINQTN
ncbi:curlin subunit CsgB [Vibrio sp. ZSDZ65]|uniref:Curlin subunit CsgB n=1 Tax=Vibrio qingdaonensis TaxID=2829491 RepID=A0A9X3CLQ4_9VIBR|nr:curlin subunit CsgB [Vibrio qingdaonensis]MCW8345701.1 curlin subunit CsgB [Vibrio qingdaonensis]